ncbi:hypothetical protein HRbin29_01303 [bacterium HR29]|jgi:alpha-beta hydrolase superfamily lysophospholipase|nr:hypothetical protein HRbin29_01303 [bacterium HR29]
MTSPYFWDDDPDEGEPAEELTLSIRRVSAAYAEEPGALRVLIHTSRGEIPGMLTPVEGGTGAVVCVSGALGGLDGPADSIYRRLAPALAAGGVTTLRLDYRRPNEFDECVLDVLAGCSFLKGLGALDVALVGHSFGGAVVIKAGQLAPIVRAVAALSSQLYGTREVQQLGKPLLLVHGMEDTVLSYEASEEIYRRAAEPKRLVLYAEAGHSLFQAKDELFDLLLEWIPAHLSGRPMDAPPR